MPSYPSYFDEDQGGAPAAAAEPAAQDEGKHEDDQGETQTALLPKAVFPHEPQVGDHCTFEVKALHDQEVSVAYVEDHEEDKPSEGAGSAPPPAPGGMGGMLE